MPQKRNEKSNVSEHSIMTTAQAIQEMMAAWNASLAAAKQEFPDATEEQLYQIVKGVMDRAIAAKPRHSMDLRSIEGAKGLAAEFDKKARALPIPDRHVYESMNVPQQTAWVNGRPGGSMSAFIRLKAENGSGGSEEQQLHVEVRVFLDNPRAILFADVVGQRYAGKTPRSFLMTRKNTGLFMQLTMLNYLKNA